MQRGATADAARSHGGSAIRLRCGSVTARKWMPIRVRFAGTFRKPRYLRGRSTAESFCCVGSFKYLGVNISEDLTWTTHFQTQVKKARQRLYHLQQLRKFRVSPTILKTFYSGTIERVLTQCISVWYGNSSSQDCKALQRVVRLAERISGSALPSLQDIYLKRCRSRAVKIIKDSNHPSSHQATEALTRWQQSEKTAKTERLRRSFFPQAIRLLNSNSAS